jgi:hypothetical protein
MDENYTTKYISVVDYGENDGEMNTRNWCYRVIFMIIIISIIIVVILVIWRPWYTTDGGLNEACLSNQSCRPEYICLNGLCKSIFGGPCETISDCTPQAASCTNNRCVDPGSVPTPIPYVPPNNNNNNQSSSTQLAITSYINSNLNNANLNNANLNNVNLNNANFNNANLNNVNLNNVNKVIPCDNGTCPLGMSCAGNIVRVNGTSKYQFNDIIDIAYINPLTLILLNNGNIIKISGSLVMTIKNNVRLRSIVAVGDRLYGVSSGYIYELKNDVTSNNYKWIIVSQLSHLENVQYLSYTLDGNYLWISTFDCHCNKNYNDKNTNKNKKCNCKSNDKYAKGYLYSVDSDGYLNRVIKENIDKHIVRVYGLNSNIYMDINTKNDTAIFTNRNFEQNITDIVSGAITPTNQIIKITTTTDKVELFQRVYGSNSTDVQIFEVYRRLCQ